MVEKQEGKVNISDAGVISKDEEIINANSCSEDREVTDYWDISGAMDPTPGVKSDARGDMKLQSAVNEANEPEAAKNHPDHDNVISLTAEDGNAMKQYCDNGPSAIEIPQLGLNKNNYNLNNNNTAQGGDVVLFQKGDSDAFICKNSDPFADDRGNNNCECNLRSHQKEHDTVGTEQTGNKGAENDVNDIGSHNTVTSGVKDNCVDGDNKTSLSIREEMMLNSECTEERFRIDRKKLEQMLQAASEGRGQSGEDFFQKIMDDTNTYITWPSKLKIGAKSKKDPHIRICGKPDNIKEARQRIMLSLDTKSNRVTIKMDVSHTEHSHVIGKGGNNIKRVMQETGCHIHFPDSNRNTAGEKSNQVSITGHPEGVENARLKIRSLLPIVLQFEIPNTRLPIPDLNSPMIQHLVQVYGISIQFKQRAKVYCTSCTVRGSSDNTEGLKTGMQTLMNHVAGAQLPVTTQIEIAPQHHNYMLTKTGLNVATITQSTGARIIFPDPTALPKKSTVYISGTTDSVILARHKLMGCLPLLLMFDMKEDTESTNNDANKVAHLMETLDLSINLKSKPKQPSRTVIIKGIESNIYNMFEARAKLLGLESSGVSRPSQSLSPKMSRNATITPTPVILLAHSHVPTPTVQTAVIGLQEQKAVTPLPGVVLGGPSYVLPHSVPSNSATARPLSVALTAVHTPSHSPYPGIPTPNGSITNLASNPMVSKAVLQRDVVDASPRKDDIPGKGYPVVNSNMSPPTNIPMTHTVANEQRHYQMKVTSAEEIQRQINQRTTNSENTGSGRIVTENHYVYNQGTSVIAQNGSSRRSSQNEDYQAVTRQTFYSDFNSNIIPKTDSFEDNRVMLSPSTYDPTALQSMANMPPLITSPGRNQMNAHILRQTTQYEKNQGILSNEELLRQQLGIVDQTHPSQMQNSDSSSRILNQSGLNSLNSVPSSTIRQSIGQSMRSPDSIGESRASLTSERNSPLSSISDRYNGGSNPRLGGFEQFDDQAVQHSPPSTNSGTNFQPLGARDINSLSPMNSHHRNPPQIVLNQNSHGRFEENALPDNAANLSDMYPQQQQNMRDIGSGPPPGFEAFAPAGRPPNLKSTDYENLSKLAKKAIKNKPVSSEVRTPTDVWAGWGFSKSMPFEMKEELKKLASSRGRFRSNLPTTYENGDEMSERNQPSPVEEESDYMDTHSLNRLRVPLDVGKGSSNLAAWRRRRLVDMNLSLGGNMGLNYMPSQRPSSQKHSAFTPIHPNDSMNRSLNSPKANPVTVTESMPQTRPVISSPFNNSGNENTLHVPLPEKPKSYDSRIAMSGTPTIQDSLGLNSNSSSSSKVEADISDVLTRLGLSKYISVFQQQEVDYQTFLTLTEPDLKELGISTFGPRKKILLAINDLNKDRDVFSGPMTNDSNVRENISDQMLQLQRLQLQQHRDNPQTTAPSHLDSHHLLSPSRQLFNSQNQQMQNHRDLPSSGIERGVFRKENNHGNERVRSVNASRLWQNSRTGVSNSGRW